jgi:hypothetical protein
MSRRRYARVGLGWVDVKERLGITGDSIIIIRKHTLVWVSEKNNYRTALRA